MRRAVSWRAKKLLRAEASAVARAVKEGKGELAAVELVVANIPNWERMLLATGKVTALQYRRLAIIQAEVGKGQKATHTRAARRAAQFQEDVAAYLREEGAKHIEQISKASIAQMRRILAEIPEPEKAAKAIETLLHRQAPARALRIAKTETHSVAMYASKRTAQESGRILFKEWVATFRNTREWHAEAHGNVQPLEGTFIVGNEEMDRPGDPSASADNLINCECTLVFTTEVG